MDSDKNLPSSALSGFLRKFEHSIVDALVELQEISLDGLGLLLIA
jgi:hypothetical protein